MLESACSNNEFCVSGTGARWAGLAGATGPGSKANNRQWQCLYGVCVCVLICLKCVSMYCDKKFDTPDDDDIDAADADDDDDDFGGGANCGWQQVQGYAPHTGGRAGCPDIDGMLRPRLSSFVCWWFDSSG